MLPLAAPADGEVRADGLDALRGRSDDTSDLSFHETTLLLCDLDIADIARSSEGDKEYLAVYMGERLAFSSKTCDRDAF